MEYCNSCVGVFLIILAGILELFQPFFGRSGDIRDFLYACLGVFFALSIWIGCTRAGLKTRAFFISLAMLSFFSAFIPLLLIRFDCHKAMRNFPQLADFESRLEFLRWDCNDCDIRRVEEYATHGRYAAEVDIQADSDRYPGIFLSEMPSDWQQVERLCFDLVFPLSGQHMLWIRIDDRPDQPVFCERFQKNIMVTQGLNRIVVSRSGFEKTSGGRLMDLSNIQQIGIFLDKSVPGMIFYVDNIRLGIKGNK